jgi:hypothetical protein
LADFSPRTAPCPWAISASREKSLVAHQPFSWGLLLKVLSEDFGVHVDVQMGVGAFACMKQMSHLLDFAFLTKEGQSGLASLMGSVDSNSKCYWFFCSLPVNADIHLSQDRQ